MAGESVQKTDNVTTMEGFFEKHGVDGALGNLNSSGVRQEDSPGRAPDTRPRETSGSPGKLSSDDPGDEYPELDVATLKELGLASEEEGEPADAPSSDDVDDTTQDGLDLGAFAKHLGVDPKDLVNEQGTLKVRTKVDGEEGLTPLADLRTGYQLRQHFNRQNEAFLQQRQAWEEAQKQQIQEHQQHVAIANQILLADEQAIVQKYQAMDWNGLRETDPAEFAARQQDFQREVQQVRGRRAQILQGFSNRVNEFTRAQGEQLRQLSEVGAKELAQLEGWKDEESFSKGSAELREYLVNKVKMPPQVVGNLVDPYLLHTLNKAAKFDKLMARVSQAKRVQPVGKMPAGGTPNTSGGRKQKIQKSLDRVRADGSVESAAAAFQQLGVLRE